MPSVIITPDSGNGTPITLPQYVEVGYGNRNEVTFTWGLVTDNVFYEVQQALSRNVQVERNRAGTYVAIADPGGTPVKMEWTEYEFNGAENVERQMVGYGPLVLSNVSFHRLAEQTVMTLYRVHYVFIRGTNQSYDLTGLVM